ncbi:structural maintenance of chromosomes protein 3 homolog [Phlebotomus papatasi]|uniref:structural maintenance of chromosomes protein 3 homolog n=1 Tax=Phlebotomus papatasi TaxID=29031 RepID=UPI0024844703|nr:structural maintenance of chromosomes protein 3 homolog [Phlebotomus papatasi]
MIIKELEIDGVPGFPPGSTYSFAYGINVLHGAGGENRKKILQAIQFVLDPMYWPKSLYNVMDPLVREDAFIEIRIEMDLKYLKLRRSLHDPSKGSINGQRMAVEDFYQTMAAECITPQIVLFDGNLLVFMRDFSEENWLNWLKMELDLVYSLDEEFGEKLDLVEKGKRKATSLLAYTSERLNHIGKCIEVEENLEILRAVRAKKCYQEIKQIVKDFLQEKKNVMSRESQAELLLSKLYVERLGTEASIFMLNTERSVIEIQKALCQDFSFEDDRGDGNIVDLMDLLAEVVDNVEVCIGKIQSDSVVPDVESRNYKIQLFTMCLERPQVARSLELEKNLLNKRPGFERDFRNSLTEIRKTWKEIEKKIAKSQDHYQ